ncbi:murein DD-endopeptidase MepM/ murein hydrolase activator NlpD [Mycetocola sp. BIGb0189]|uniref:M23 family metallopeptidase n=1 Tax=Mycetocola sp. BIGb0189 TaxID=2940604 RepID=UPI00216A2DC5|nr:M23 family metallopeptidase [Mycetocola sp. BIGb0189]MCS4275428.1 murein DD-endopeptidase MepM/ murein hydrolase activator NlpD [Mycetocola sp. BIGb0189]
MNEPRELNEGLSRRTLIAATAVAASFSALGFDYLNSTPAKAAAPRFIWPFPDNLRTPNSGFGNRNIIQTPNGPTVRFHTGIDYGLGIANKLNTPVIAAGSGRVYRIWNAASSPTWGNRVDIAHGDGLVTVYRHMYKNDVVLNQEVVQGQRIGGTGATGVADGVHLHFQTEVNGVAKDPVEFFALYATSTPITEPESEDDMFTDDDRRILEQLSRTNLPVLVKTAASSKVWLSNLVSRRLVATVAELALVQSSLVSRGISNLVNTVPNLDSFGVPLLTDEQKTTLTKGQIDGTA